ncbi:hypothetical protein C0991_003223, partial [Blastosporella zonata]
RRPLSICLDVPASSSPFPSPSSSFLPPPMPGNHEFAMRPPPAGRGTRKQSVPNGNGTLNGANDEEVKVSVLPEAMNNLDEDQTIPLLSPTPTPPAPTSESTTPTPTPSPAPSVPPPTTPTPANITTTTPSTISIPSPLPSPSSSSTYSISQTPAPTPNRPAPPSPAVSRRVSSMSTASTRSRTPSASTSVSRASSVRRSSGRGSTSSTVATTTTTTTTTPLPTIAPTLTPAPPTPKILIHIRDYAFPPSDDRFHGKGALVPRANHLAVLHQKLAGLPDDDDDEDPAGDGDDGDVNAAWDLLRRGWGGAGVGFGFAVGFGAASGAGAAGINGNGWRHGGTGPSQAEMDLNFSGDTEESDIEDTDADEGEEDEEEPLYPGLYRAMYAFEPEGTAEMALAEDQVVRVVGRGGGVGWAVVLIEDDGPVEEGAGGRDTGEGERKKHALVPESYLEPLRLDFEDEEASS